MKLSDECRVRKDEGHFYVSPMVVICDGDSYIPQEIPSEVKCMYCGESKDEAE